MKRALAVFLMFATALLAEARLMKNWSYQELYEAADLVVVAKPSSTQDTGEKAVLPNVAPEIHVVGVATEFEVGVVMKGDKSMKKVTLHHYRLPEPKLFINGPTLVSFAPKGNAHFLLFLHRESDGRYSPVSGQTDPGLFSVLKLEGAAQ